MVIGGCFQGKKKFALEKFPCEENAVADGMNCEFEEIFEAKMVLHFHEYIRRRLEAGLDCKDLASVLNERNPGLVIVTNELGYGVVPISAFDRKYREDTGRICCKLAELSDEVWRVCCGVGNCIKGA